MEYFKKELVYNKYDLSLAFAIPWGVKLINVPIELPIALINEVDVVKAYWSYPYQPIDRRILINMASGQLRLQAFSHPLFILATIPIPPNSGLWDQPSMVVSNSLSAARSITPIPIGHQCYMYFEFLPIVTGDADVCLENGTIGRFYTTDVYERVCTQFEVSVFSYLDIKPIEIPLQAFQKKVIL